MVVGGSDDSGGCASGGVSSMKKNDCPSVLHDCAAFESVRKYFTHC